MAELEPDGKSEAPITLERLSASMDGRFETVDRRFDVIDQRFEAVDQRFDAVDRRFETVDRRFEAVDQRFDAVDAAFVEQREYTEYGFDRLRREVKEDIAVVKSGLERVERKLDRLIDRQLGSTE